MRESSCICNAISFLGHEQKADLEPCGLRQQRMSGMEHTLCVVRYLGFHDMQATEPLTRLLKLCCLQQQEAPWIWPMVHQMIKTFCCKS